MWMQQNGRLWVELKLAIVGKHVVGEFDYKHDPIIYANCRHLTFQSRGQTPIYTHKLTETANSMSQQLSVFLHCTYFKNQFEA